MRLVILSKGSEFHAVRRLAEAAARRGVTAVFVNPNECSLSSASGKLEIRQRGRILSLPDFVIPRIVPSNMVQGLNVLRALESSGVSPLVSSSAIETVWNPARLFLTLAGAGCPIPAGEIVLAPSQTMAAVKRLKAPPAWVMPLSGYGIGRQPAAMFCASEDSLRAALDVLLRLSGPVLIQRANMDSGGKRIRVFVAGGHAAACCEILCQKTSVLSGGEESGAAKNGISGGDSVDFSGKNVFSSEELHDFWSCCRRISRESGMTQSRRQLTQGCRPQRRSAVRSTPEHYSPFPDRDMREVHFPEFVPLRREPLQPHIKSAAESAAAAVGVQGFSSVDIFSGKKGAVVTGISCTPGLKCVETVLRIDIAGRVIDAVRNQARRIR